MIISRTPFRISFFGGGTDYPSWFGKHGGSVLATTIDKYCYLTCRHLPPFFEHRIRIIYSLIENCQTVDDIKHPAAREVLRFLEFDRGIEIHHDADLPARSGMGSSSAFTVGLLNAMYALTGRMCTKHQLAAESIHIEQDLIKETVGSQDQISAAYGGLNHISFLRNGEFSVTPITILPERIRELNAHLMLFYTGIKRTASDIAQTFVGDMESKKRQLRTMATLVDEAIGVLTSRDNLTAFGELLHETWEAKRALSSMVSNPEVDALYDSARAAGAIGGKLTGAGGGGFMLLFVPPDRQRAVRLALGGFVYVPFKIDFTGSQIIFCDLEQDYHEVDMMDTGKSTIKKFRELGEIDKAMPA